MPASHKDPHAGPTVGDKSFEYYFATPMDFHAAMQRAKELEKKGMYRRAWRVRLNLDGEQPIPVAEELMERADKLVAHEEGWM